MSDDEKTDPAEFLSAALVWDEEIEKYEKLILECRRKKSDVYEALAAEHGRQFKIGERWYSIKKFKKTGMFVLSGYDVAPNSWLKKPLPDVPEEYGDLAGHVNDCLLFLDPEKGECDCGPETPNYWKRDGGSFYEVHNENGYYHTFDNKEEAEKIKYELSFSCMPFIKRVSKKDRNNV